MEKKIQFLFLILLFLILTFVSFLFSPFFHLREYVVHSRNEIDQAEIRSNIARFYGENLLFLDEAELKSELLEHNLISAVRTEKSFPSTVHIVIEARTAVGWLENNDKRLVFSADGILLAEKEIEENLKLPEFEDFAYYFREDRIILPLFTEDILQVLNSLDQKFLARIEKIIYREKLFKLYLRGGGGVNLGKNKNLEDKFAILKSILAQNKEEKIDYINLQVIKHPVIKVK